MTQQIFRALNQGALVTLRLFALTLLGAVPLGLVIALGAMTRFRPLRYLTRSIIWVVRGTPLMLQLSAIYFGPGLLGFNLWGTGRQGRWIAVLTAFILNYACYFAEIYRGGLESIPKGQYEAGQVLGMTRPQIFFRVILKQVIQRILPPMGNEVITLVKDTSLARVVAVYELIWAGEAFIKSNGLIWPLFFTGLYYLAFSGILTVLLNTLERRMDYFRC